MLHHCSRFTLRIRSLVLVVFVCLVFITTGLYPVSAAPIGCSATALNDAIFAANIGSGAIELPTGCTITLNGAADGFGPYDSLGPTALRPITGIVVIFTQPGSPPAVIQRNTAGPNFRIFSVQGGTLILMNVAINNGLARGGNGADGYMGGGGGMAGNGAIGDPPNYHGGGGGGTMTDGISGALGGAGGTANGGKGGRGGGAGVCAGGSGGFGGGGGAACWDPPFPGGNGGFGGGGGGGNLNGSCYSGIGGFGGGRGGGRWGAGGGGMGAGGAVFVQSGTLMTYKVTFTGNQAIGGKGGEGDASACGGGGGDGEGGAVFNAGTYCTASLDNNTYVGNNVAGGSGGRGFVYKAANGSSNGPNIYNMPAGYAIGPGTQTSNCFMWITTLTLTNGTVSMPYSPQTITTSGGTAPYTYTLSAGALPAGLSLSTGGTLSGTPTAGGTFNFTVQATDSGPYSATQNYTLTINPPTITIAPAALTNGTVSMPYGPQTITASGGTAPYTYTISAGALPAGLSLSSGGTLSGTPTAGGTFNITVQATDSSTGTGPYSTTQNYTLTINPPTITLTPMSLIASTVGITYGPVSLSAAGGTAPYTYTISVGALPAGLTLNTGGTLSGIPTAGGTFNFTVQAQDSSTGSGSPYSGAQAYSLTISSPTITFSPAMLPNGGVGAPYSQSITASGGTTPYTYVLSVGALPGGLNLGADGTLSGTPTAQGTFNFTIQATDSSTGTGSPYSSTQAYTLTIDQIQVTPPTLPAGQINTNYDEIISASGGTGPYTLSLTAGDVSPLVFDPATGHLSGMLPATPTTLSFTITASDTHGWMGSQIYAIPVIQVTLSPVNLPAGLVGSAYDQPITASGGTAPYIYAVTAGSVAPLTLDPNTGQLSGTLPATPMTLSFTITATDQSNFTSSQAYNVVVSQIILNPARLPGGAVNAPYTQTISAVGGTAPYIYAVTAGSVAPLTLDPNTGVLSGMAPASPQTLSFTVTASDKNGLQASQAYTIALVYFDGSPSIFPAAPPVCGALNGSSLPYIRASVPNGTATLNERPANVYCGPLSKPEEHGVLDRTVIHAIEVFALTMGDPVIPVTKFNNPILVCLQGQGALLFRDANTVVGQNRSLVELPSYIQDGFTCTSVPNAGTLILVEGTPTLIMNPPGIGSSGRQSLDNCTVTTKAILNLHATPDTVGTVLNLVPYLTTLKATVRQGDWLQVVYRNDQGWLNARYLNFDGFCGQ